MPLYHICTDYTRGRLSVAACRQSRQWFFVSFLKPVDFTFKMSTIESSLQNAHFRTYIAHLKAGSPPDAGRAEMAEIMGKDDANE